MDLQPGLVPGFFLGRGMTPQDFRTDTWRRFTKHLAARLEELREANDTPASELATAAMRGKIAMVKELLALSPDSASEDVDPE